MSDFLSDTARKISKTHDFNILFIGGWQNLIPHGDIVDVITPINILFRGGGKFWPLMKIKMMTMMVMMINDQKLRKYQQKKLELFSWGFSIGHFGSRRQGTESRRTTNLLAVAYYEKTIAPLKYLKIYCVCIRDWKKRQQKWRLLVKIIEHAKINLC